MLQSSQVLSFFRPREDCGDWSQRELAEFYRVEAALVGSGISIATDRGVTDEGEPWFVFYRQDNEEVIVHFARIDGEYIVVSNLTEGIARGRNFQVLVRELLESHPYVLPKSGSRRQTVYLHPAALLAALVVTSYVKSAELNIGPDDQVSAEKGSGWVFNRHDLVAYSAIVIAAVWDSLSDDPSANRFADFAWLEQANTDHDVAELSVASQSADGNVLLGNLVFEDAQDHSVLAAATFTFEQQAVSDAGRDGWSVASTEAKSLANQAASHHSDSNLTESAAEFSRLERDWNGKSAGQEQVDLLHKSNLDPVIITKPGSSTAPSEVSAASEHAISTSSTSVFSTGFADVSRAQDMILSALHIDPQALNSVLLTATNLTDAIQATLSEFFQESTAGSPETSAFGSTAIASAVSDTSTYSAPLFDAAARAILDQFLRDTPQIRIESFGDDFLIVDTNMSHFASNEFSVETWTMSDGSTLSILGIVPHHDDALAA